VSTLTRFFKRHGVRRCSPAEAQAILRRPALTVDPDGAGLDGTMEPHSQFRVADGIVEPGDAQAPGDS